MWRQSVVIAVLIASLSSAAANLQEIDLPNDTSHPERDATRAIEKKDFGFIGLYGLAYMVPAVDEVYDRFSKKLQSQLKVVRGTSDIHGNDPSDINVRARAYAERYNRVLLDWLETHHRDWLGPRQPLTR
jgi:hypothetical protein